MQPGVDAFVVFEGRFLLILRDDFAGIQNPNMWNLPGGGINYGESEESAIIRELSEEINFSPSKIQFLNKTLYADGNIVSKFLVKITDDERLLLKLGEGQKMEFFTYDQALKLNIVANLRAYINLHRKMILRLISVNSIGGL